MTQNRRYRTINILITLAGLAACTASCLVPDRTGILDGAGVSLIQTMGPVQSVYQFILPSVLALISALLVIMGKGKILAMVSTLAASGMYAYMDWGHIASRQSCPVILINMIGIVLLITGVILQCFATPCAAEMAREERRERAEEGAEKRLESSMYFGAESMPLIKEEDTEGPDEIDVSEKLAVPEEPEVSGETEESKKKKRPKKKAAVSWTTDEELAELLKKEIKKQRTE